MSQEAKYSYIQWLPENRMVIATVQAMLEDKYISGLLGKNIFPYARDDNPDFILPSVSVTTGEVFSYDNEDRLEGEIVINAYFGLDLIRNKTTEVVETTMSTIRARVQNYNFYEAVALNMFDYNKTLSNYRTDFDKASFKEAMTKRHPLQRYGISLRSKPATSYQLNSGISCYKAIMSFKYWVMQQNWYEFLELLGVNAQDDPNKIVYNLWEEFYPNIEELP